MSDFRTAINSHPQDQADGLNMGNVMPRTVPAAAKNYAEDEDVARHARDEIAPLIQQARMDRKTVDQRWASIRNMELMLHDENRKYVGRSNAYLPIHAKNLQIQQTQLVKAIFPSDDYMDCVSADDDKEKALKSKHYMMYQFEKIAFLRMYMKLFARQLLNYGWSVLKFWYRMPRPYAKARGSKINVADITKLAYGPEYQQDTQEQGLTVSARSIFNFYAFPFTAETLRETVLQFEDIKMSMMEVEHWAKVEKWAKVESIKAAPKPSDVQSDSAQNFDVHGVPPANDEVQTSKQADTRVVTECYTFLELPASEYTDADAKGCPLPVRIIFIGDEPVHIQRNASYHQASPFLGLSINNSPGFMLGYGPGQMTAPLQYLANDFANQTNDVCIYGLNPIVKVVPGMLVGALRPMAPGVTWHMNDLSAVDIIHPPTEQVGTGMTMLQALMTMAQDFGGAPPIMQGTNARGSGKTATGSQILQSNASAPMQDMAEDIENEVLVPLASRGYALAQQFAPDRILADVFGVVREISKDDLLFNAKWRFLGSTQAANAQMRAYQATSYVQLVARLTQQLATQGVQVNLLPLLKKIGNDALGFRGLDEVFKQGPTPMPGMLPGAPGAQVVGAPGAEAPRSPAASSNLGSLPMQPGEGGGFDQVRDNADALSAAMGGMGGMGGYGDE